METVEFLSQVDIFKNLQQSDLQRLAGQLTQVSFPEGNIIKDNDAADGLYIIKTGNVKVTKSAAESVGVEAVLAILKPGNSFGELSLIDGLPRSANVTAMGPVECYFLPRAAFLASLREDPVMALGMLISLAGMVRSADQWVSQLI
ncbi:MAG: cyclic nucleotide-binding domain-containing protein [Chloroflexi bacterium]|nr:cyclic nucleotide-binding domain-containing protein [Chloroflexota bacterium]